MNIIRKLIGIRDAILEKRISNAFERDNYKSICHYRLVDIELIRNRDIRKYCAIKNEVERIARERLMQQTKIKVAFVLYSASMWSCDELYSAFNNNPRFDPYIILLRTGGTALKEMESTFEKSKAFFEKKHYCVHQIRIDFPKSKCYKEMGCPDIVFFLIPYDSMLPVGANISYMPASVLTVYIPYSYMLSDAPKKYLCPGMTTTWRHYAESENYRTMLIEHDVSYARNTFFYGYPKMDAYYDSEPMKNNLWHMSDTADKNKVKKIIYAPHHSLPSSSIGSQHFSTFNQNYKFFLEYAKSHCDTTSWIIKPHPILRKVAIVTGLFPTIEAYENYLDEWRNLPNACVVEESTYIDVFKSSDAMILDSVSFLAEYQFTGKPLLFLRSGTERFNSFGRELLECQYTAKGDDFSEIQSFIDNVVIGGMDSKKTTRESFFQDNMEYYCKNGRKTASEKIYCDICDAVTG